MKIDDLKKIFPKNAQIIDKYESKINELITTIPEYNGFNKLLNSFIFLFSDDLVQTLNFSNLDLRILLYSEAFKRIRSSSLLAYRGYYMDANSMLRSVFELNKGINAIQNNVINAKEYLGKSRDDEFKNLSDKEKYEKINEHSRSINNKINNFDDKNVPNELKDSIRNFKLIMHISVHKSLANIVLNYTDYISEGKGNLFHPDNNIEIFELYLNNVSLVILMFLKNITKSGLLLEGNKQKIKDLVQFLEDAYSSMSEKYYSDVAKYIRIKY